jgi:hypothetical protein
MLNKKTMINMLNKKTMINMLNNILYLPYCLNDYSTIYLFFQAFYIKSEKYASYICGLYMTIYINNYHYNEILYYIIDHRFIVISMVLIIVYP